MLSKKIRGNLLDSCRGICDIDLICGRLVLRQKALIFQLILNNSSSDLGTGLEQDSITLGLRYELGSAAALKLEAQRVEPEGDSRGLLMEPTDDVNIYSIAVDVIF